MQNSTHKIPLQFLSNLKIKVILQHLIELNNFVLISTQSMKQRILLSIKFYLILLLHLIQTNIQYYSHHHMCLFFLSEKNKLNDINSTLVFLFLTKKNFPNLETNILFLKNIQFFFFFKD